MELVVEYLDRTQSKIDTCDKCGGTLGIENTGGVRKCLSCGNHTNKWGENVSLSELGYCKGCGETFIKHYRKVASKDELYSCSECHTIHDRNGLIVDSAELIKCENCDEYFRYSNYPQKHYKCPPIGAKCYCPACNHFLDASGKVVDFGVMHKCISCNISFSSELADSNYGLTKCIDCGEYIDDNGHYIDPRFIESCQDCGIEFNKLEFNGVCPICWRTPNEE